MATTDSHTLTPIAIVGIGCFFPKAAGTKGYWHMLSRGLDGLSDVPAERWSVDDYYDPDPKAVDRVCTRRGGFLDPIPFDPTEWGIPPNALEATDTSQLLALVAAKLALSDAGYAVDGGKPFDRGRTGVILGITGAQELVIPLGARLDFPKWRRALTSVGLSDQATEQAIERIAAEYVGWKENSFPGLLGNVVAGRICNRLNLSGTNCVVDAACASSMAAIHMAVMELVSHRSDMMLTGGVDTFNDIFMHMCFAKTNILSPSGDAKPFSADADGTVLGEGVGILALKRLSDAEKDRDRIYAVIRGIGTSSDGKSQSIYAPRPDGQAKALRKAYADAGIDPASVQLIEAHGTGTRVGDAVEFSALRDVFHTGAAAPASIAVGSVKSMIGHTKAAAGTAGLIKLALALYHKVLPPTLKVTRPDPKLRIEDSPFYLNRQSRPWIVNDRAPRRAGISSFGFGGSNYHAVLEEHGRAKPEPAWDGSCDIFAFSAGDPETLAAEIQTFVRRLTPDAPAEQFAHAAAQSRLAFKAADRHRLLVNTDNPRQGCLRLTDALQRTITALRSGKTPSDPTVFYGDNPQTPGLAFVFPGQGSQYVGMGRDLMCIFPEAFHVLESAEAVLTDVAPLSGSIFPPGAYDEDTISRLRSFLDRTDRAQPAIGVVSVAMLQVLQRFGITPDAACGHSFGELTALHAAGVFGINTLIDLAALRGRLMAAAAGDTAGAMLAIRAPLKQIDRLVNENRLDLVLANRNSPSQGVLSGPAAQIEKAEVLCRQMKYSAARLPVSAAFHSPLMQDAQAPYRNALNRIECHPPQVPVYANATGKRYPDDAEGIRNLMGSHLLSPVNFIAEIENLYQADVRTFVEVGPKTVLTGLIDGILDGRRYDAMALDASAGRGNGLGDLATVLCRLAAAGYPVALDQWETGPGEPRSPKMQIDISGANLWQRPNEPTPAYEGASAALPQYEPSQPPAASIDGNPPKPDQPDGQQEAMKTDDPFSPSTSPDGLAVIQAGLKAMQSLHQQTADAHQTFLETQKDATRALQRMMDHSRALLNQAPAHDMPTPSDVDASRLAAGSAAQASLPKTPPAATVTPPSPPTISSQPRWAEAPAPPVPVEDEPREVGSAETAPPDIDLTPTLVAVVGELTGYPTEMIGMDMDIEADLGIDSIKRVEILSTLEERLPDLPAVPPEELGSMKTLAEIQQFLSQTLCASGRGPAAIHATAPSNADPPTAAPSGAIDLDDLSARLLTVVGELTGYPTEMIGMDMDIEADLGIDSIKRVEILSTLEEKLPDLPTIAPESLGSLNTLQEIVRTIAQAGRPSPDHAAMGSLSVESLTAATTEAPVSEAEQAPSIGRHRVVLREKPALRAAMTPIPKGRKVFITDDRTGLSRAIADELSRHDVNTVLVSPDILTHKDKLPSAGGLILVYGPETALDSADMKTAFGLAQHLGPDLQASAQQGGAVFGAVVRMDGGFGFRGGRLSDPFQGGIAGLVKTAGIEWPSVTCRVVDVHPEWTDYTAVAHAVTGELFFAGAADAPEVGFDAGRRSEPILVTDDVDAVPNRPVDLAIAPDDVVVVSGGARGITAAAVCELVKHCRPRLVLLGRSPAPAPEPEWLSGLTDDGDIKAAILHNEFERSHPTPAELERVFNQHTTNREIGRTLDHLHRAGIEASYHPVDILDRQAVGDILTTVRSQSGPIRALIHGAGVLKDRLIMDKSMAQFDTVFGTKVTGLHHLLAAVPEKDLRYLIVFSSVAARFGNRGQADYAMANEVLNKMAWLESKRRSGCKVLSINWGPWDGGMVTKGLKREFDRRGVALIPVQQGARRLVMEMADTECDAAEVVIGGPLVPAAAPRTTATVPPDLDSQGNRDGDSTFGVLFQQDVDVKEFPVIGDHQLDGRPVIPLALMTEWFGHGALHENPGLYLHGLDDLRVLQGIKLDDQKRTVRLLATKARKTGSFFEVDLELRDGMKDGVDVVHSKARAILSEAVVTPPPFDQTLLDAPVPYPRSVEEIYEQVLFHGDRLRGIDTILHLDQRGMAARVSTAPSPTEWVKKPLRNRWVADPLIVDGAFQMASIWCYEQMGMVSLPSYCQSYRQYTHRFPDGLVTAVLEIEQTGRNKMVGRFTFLDADRKVLATIAGFEAVVDDSLYRAFKPQRAQAG